VNALAVGMIAGFEGDPSRTFGLVDCETQGTFGDASAHAEIAQAHRVVAEVPEKVRARSEDGLNGVSGG
jgi:hypothetical protein